MKLRTAHSDQQPGMRLLSWAPPIVLDAPESMQLMPQIYAMTSISTSEPPGTPPAGETVVRTGGAGPQSAPP